MNYMAIVLFLAALKKNTITCKEEILNNLFTERSHACILLKTCH